MIFSALFGLNSLAIIITLLIGLYFYLIRNYKYWSSRGIDGPKPIPGLGTFWQIFSRTLGEINMDNYKKFGKIYGIFIADRPVLVVSDPEIIKDMNIRDFHLFVDRNDFETGDPINDRSMFNLKSDEWKKMRSIISPTFSSGKMRSMHPIIIDCIKRLDKHLSDKKEVEMKKTMGNLTMDVIATCAFGTQIDTYNDQKRSEFILNAQKVFRGSWRVWAVFVLMQISRKLLEWTGLKFLDPTAQKFFVNAIKSIVTQRKSEGNTKKHRDYLQLMINAQNKTLDTNDDHEVVVDDKSDEIYGATDSLKYNKPKGDVSDTDLLATSLIFFVAGYETTATTLANVVYSLAINPDCQQKLYEEIRQFDGKYDYESIAQMPYLEACVAETLRLYNPLTAVSRIAAEEYTIGNTGLTIPKGMIVNFDIEVLHHNPDYYPEPDRWNPERFMPYNRDKLVPYTYMPFGLGPRNCVGMRFALMEAKTAIAYLIMKYKFVKTANTTIPLKPKKYEFLLTTGPINVGIEKRN
ncbi:cytochrome P450 3A8-like [Oppia nitens]|uniref:cytochrome P450 3A8-like n=1 Tax=Oppia nitens TaxID=1686743 RepID=UPI0023DB264F|nr:cytochrome P450 3A8-like [Oppia nitens]